MNEEQKLMSPVAITKDETLIWASKETDDKNDMQVIAEKLDKIIDLLENIYKDTDEICRIV